MYDSYFKCLWSGCLEWTMPNIKNAIIQGSDIEGEGYFEAKLHFYEQLNQSWTFSGAVRSHNIASNLKKP